MGSAETPQPDKLPDHPGPKIAAGFPIVGIGASAGGLAAFEAFFAGLPAATQLGVARGALVTQPFSRFIHQEDADSFYLLRKQLLATGRPQTCELQMAPSDGSQFWAQLAATVAPADDGPPGLRVVLTDITARKQSEEVLRQHMEELTQFNAAAVGRELRMIELKQQVNELARQLGQPPPYNLEELMEAVPGSPPAPGRGITGPKPTR